MSGDDVNSYLEDCCSKHIAPIQRKYLIERQRCSEEDDLVDRKHSLEEDSGENAKPRTERRRGQNKSRKSNLNVAIKCLDSQLCKAAALGLECTKGEKCTRSHDSQQAVIEFEARILNLETAPAALKTCPWISRGEFCEYGLNCQSYSPHPFVDKDNFIESTRREVNKSHSIISSTKGENKENTESKEDEDERSSVMDNRTKLRSLLSGKAILAPMTTVGNLPFRRLCISYGAEVTMSEMILASSLVSLKSSDLSLLRRHEDEKIFGIQLAGGFPDVMIK